MNRIAPKSHVELVGFILKTLPAGIASKIGEVDWVIDNDPVAMGLQTITHSGGRSLRNTSHVIWLEHQAHLSGPMRSSTVALLGGDERDPEIILHELGHILDERLGFSHPPAIALDAYAATNEYEAFATAFQSWSTIRGPDLEFYHNRDRVRRDDPRIAAFFDQLAEGTAL